MATMRLITILVTLSIYHCVSAYRKPWRRGLETAAAESRTPFGDQLSNSQRLRLHTVADLLLDIYHTLADMRFLDPAGIETGPHTIDIEFCQEQNIATSIIYLYQILPYVNVSEAGQHAFAFGGQLADYRNVEYVSLGRDPFYSGWQDCGSQCFSDDPLDQNLPYIEPWTTPLTAMGNHEAVIIYDSKQDTIKVVDQLDDQSRDPALRDVRTPWRTSSNRNSIDHIPGRSAADFLRDMVRWYRSLDLIPGDDIDNGLEAWDYDAFKLLYQEAGWPDAFDSDAFDVSLVRYQARESARYQLNEPLHQVEKYQTWEEFAAREVLQALDRIALAVNEDDLWLANFDLWKAIRHQIHDIEELEHAEAEARRLCPSSDCLSPDSLLLHEVEHLRSWLEGAWSDDYSLPRHRAARRNILQRAFYKAESEIKDLYPEQYEAFWTKLETPRDWFQQEVIRIQDTCEAQRKDIRDLEKWLSNELPVSAQRARKVAREELKMQEESREANLWQARSYSRRQFAMWNSASHDELLPLCRIAPDAR